MRITCVLFIGNLWCSFDLCYNDILQFTFLMYPLNNWWTCHVCFSEGESPESMCELEFHTEVKSAVVKAVFFQSKGRDPDSKHLIHQTLWIAFFKQYYSDLGRIFYSNTSSAPMTPRFLYIYFYLYFLFFLSFWTESSIRDQWWMEKVIPALFSTLIDSLLSGPLELVERG